MPTTSIDEYLAEPFSLPLSTHGKGDFRHVLCRIKEVFGHTDHLSETNFAGNGQKGQIGQTNYSAAKAGMHGFTKALAQEVAGKGITVNTVSPGYVATEMVMAVPEAIREKIIAQIPVGRLGLPDEIAAAISYLVSDEAGFVTGSDLSINGGQYMQ